MSESEFSSLIQYALYVSTIDITQHHKTFDDFTPIVDTHLE